ncbi:MAG: hypothetical protein AAFW89_08020 [Bacteroidota bacterium]
MEEPVTEEQAPADTLESSVDSAKTKELIQKQNELQKDLESAYREELMDKYQMQANAISTFYINAQQHFFNGNYERAMYYIREALKIRENADIYALKGNIHLAQGSTTEFLSSWKRALELDETIPIPGSEVIIKELQRSGLIDDNQGDKKAKDVENGRAHVESYIRY